MFFLKQKASIRVTKEQSKNFTLSFRHTAPTLGQLRSLLKQFDSNVIELGWGNPDGFDSLLSIDEVHYVNNSLLLVGCSYYLSVRDYCKTKVWLFDGSMLFRASRLRSKRKQVCDLLRNLSLPDSIPVFLAFKGLVKHKVGYVVPIKEMGPRILVSYPMSRNRWGAPRKGTHTVHPGTLSIWGEIT